MAYGDYDGPDKPNKGLESGACNRQRCQAEPALWYNHGSYAWYCEDCMNAIYDDWGRRNWALSFEPKCGHPQFETREMITEREAKEDAVVVHRLERPAYEFREPTKVYSSKIKGLGKPYNGHPNNPRKGGKW